MQSCATFVACVLLDGLTKIHNFYVGWFYHKSKHVGEIQICPKNFPSKGYHAH